ncbi:MAG: iron uptake porin [Oscillatoriales cyanobacterium SM2_3_0]|nr:iron uptake porin [Oscillatoriales cyanobacterium SM2_3_0]
MSKLFLNGFLWSSTNLITLLTLGYAAQANEINLQQTQPQTLQQAQIQTSSPTDKAVEVHLSLEQAQHPDSFQGSAAVDRSETLQNSSAERVDIHPQTPQNLTEIPANPTVETPTLDQLNQYTREGRNQRQSQVTSVSQLSDVQPTDWAFQALQSLVERYGCIAGYPDGTYKGNRALTRYEFAAGVNACLERITELIDASTNNLVTREDLAKLQRLMEEFAAELAALRGRVTVLEARTAELEANQFSTTTKLNGQVIFVLGDTFGDRATYNVNGNQGPDGRGLVDDDDDPTQTFLGYRVRLDLETSFTGEDLLITRLQAANVNDLTSTDLTNTLMSQLAIDDGVTDGVELDDLFYIFPIFDGNGEVYIGANSLDLDDAQEPLNPLADESSGVVSAFARYNPASFRGPQGVGLVAKYGFGETAQLNLAYLASDGANANDGAGLFNGAYSATAQLVFYPFEALGLAVEYNHRYFTADDVSVSGGTGSFIANKPFGDSPTSSDNLGFQTNWEITDWFALGGWFGITWANQQGSDLDSTILNWAITLSFPDLLKEGDGLGIVVGIPPKVVEHSISDLEDQDTSLHIEGFYRFQLSDYIGITPGFFVVTNPDHNDNNDTIFVGVIRTTFQF